MAATECEVGISDSCVVGAVQQGGQIQIFPEQILYIFHYMTMWGRGCYVFFGRLKGMVMSVAL